MDNNSRIIVTSCKGGVGKSTVAANLAYALALADRKVLLLDMDFGNKCLDVMLGVEDDFIYDITDVAAGRCEPEAAVRELENRKGLFFCAAPFIYEGDLTEESLGKALLLIEEKFGVDYTVLDTSGGAESSVRLASACAGRALIVTTPFPAAVRASSKTASLLYGYGIKESYLVVNSLDTDIRLADKRYGVLDMIDCAGVPVIGIVPKSDRLALITEKGILALEDKKEKDFTGAAFSNIALRLSGGEIPLLSGVRNIRRRGRLLTSGSGDH